MNAEKMLRLARDRGLPVEVTTTEWGHPIPVRGYVAGVDGEAFDLERLNSPGFTSSVALASVERVQVVLDG